MLIKSRRMKIKKIKRKRKLDNKKLQINHEIMLRSNNKNYKIKNMK